MNCRHCKKKLTNEVIDLGFAPPSNAYLQKKHLLSHEKYYPLKIYVCDSCWLVQTLDFNKPKEFFNETYAYFSSTSRYWLEHARTYSLKIKKILKLNNLSNVIEIASNDGYLLKNFVKMNIPCIGIEPTSNTAKFSKRYGIKVIEKFFTKSLAQSLKNKNLNADLIIGNNVYAHVPDINNFTAGLKILLKKEGTITLEFPHLYKLIRNKQFDTIYHEHFSYLSLTTVTNIFKKNGLKIYNVERLKTHGGSLRIYGCHNNSNIKINASVQYVLDLEKKFNLNNLSTYRKFQANSNLIKNNLIKFLIEKKLKGQRVLAYGAAAKGNTFLNYAGIKSDLIEYVFDAASSKQNKYLPGSHIKILHPSQISKFKFNYLLILPWNIASEIKNQLSFLKKKKIKFIIAVPKIKEL